jgi:sulfur-oxidizing protein SoxY
MTTVLSRRRLGELAWVYLLWPHGAHGASFRPDVEAAIVAHVGTRRQQVGRVHIDLPAVTEDGASVLIGISVDSPMSADDYVAALHLFATENPNPEVASLRFTPASGKADVILRIRLAKSQVVIAIAEMSDGSVFRAQKYTKVTIGGCAGAN